LITFQASPHTTDKEVIVLVRIDSVTGTVVLFLAVCILTGGTPALAGEKVFNVYQAVEFSLHNNGELKALRDDKGVREAGRIKAGLYPNPVLELEGRTGELTGSRFENSISVGVSQEFLTMGKRGKRLRVAEKEIESFDRQIDNSGRLLEEEVKTIFYDLLLAGKRVELAERSIALTTQLLEVTKLRLEAGDIPELEMNLARVEVARSAGRKVEAERELYPSRARLLALMGLPPNEEASFSGAPEARPFAKNLGELKRWALAKRPDIRALEGEQARGDAEIALARAERIPNVTAGLGYQHENSVVNVGGAEGKNSDNLIGLKISIPIPLFDRNQAGVRVAQARKGSADNRYLFARTVVEREVEGAFARLTAADKTLSIYSRDIIPQLEENLKLVQEAYRLGEVGILAVIEEQKKFFEVNDGYLSALHGRNMAFIKLESAVAVDLTGGVQ
jgi:cobalt-zinc-cadmium efflux system outer membrane protein